MRPAATPGGRRWALAAVSTALALLPMAAGAQGLNEALKLAYESSPALAAERAGLRAAEERVNQAGSSRRPRVVAEGSGVLQDVSPGTPNQSDSLVSASIGVDQTLYGGGRDNALIGQRDAEVRAARARLAAVEQSVLLDVVRAYTRVVHDRAVVDLNRSNKRVIERRLEATRDRFRVGELTRTDVAQAESRLSAAAAQLARADRSLVQARSAFLRTVGVAPGGLGEVEPLAVLPASAAAAAAQAREGNFDLLASEYAERAAQATVQERRGALRPTATLSAQAAHDRGWGRGERDSNTLRLTARVTVPLYQSGAAASRVREAKHERARRRGERNRVFRTVTDRAATAWEAVATARSEIRAFTDAVRAARIALEGVEQEAEVGSRTVLDVLDAEQELLNARVEVVRARRDLVVATYVLAEAVGRLTARDLGLDVPGDRSEERYRRVRNRWFGLSVGE